MLKTKTIAYLLILGFLLKTGLISIAYAAGETPACGMFEIRGDCELRKWMHLILETW